MKTLKTLLSFFKLPIIVFIFAMILSYFKVFEILPWIDIPFHLIGGASIAYTFTLIFKSWEKKSLLLIKRKSIYILLIVSIVALFATLWEFWEFLMTQIFSSAWQGTLEDTMLDFLMGLLGGLFIATLDAVNK